LLLLPLSIVLRLTLAAAAVIGMTAWLAILRTPVAPEGSRNTAA
jgi:hypothetical protein